MRIAWPFNRFQRCCRIFLWSVRYIQAIQCSDSARRAAPALTDPRSSCSCYLSQKGTFLPPYVFFRSVSSPSASAVAALDQAFSQLHIVPPIQSNPHAIPDSCSTTLSLPLLPCLPSQSVRSAAAGRAREVGHHTRRRNRRPRRRSWDGRDRPLPLLPSLRLYLLPSARPTAGHADQSMPMPILPMYAVSKQDLCSHIKRTRHMITGERRRRRRRKSREMDKKVWFSLTF